MCPAKNFRELRQRQSTHSNPDLDYILKDMIKNRPMQSIPINTYKGNQEEKKDQRRGGSDKRSHSISSFFQRQNQSRNPSVESLALTDEAFSHPSVASLLTNLSDTSELMRGFELLADSQRFYVRPTMEKSGLFGEHPHKFEILDNRGFRLYSAYETKDLDMTSQGCWCGVRQVKAFKVLVVNFIGHELLRIEGEPGYCGGSKAAHFFRGKQLIGRVEQGDDYGSTSYQIMNEKDQIVCCLKGPETGCCGCGIVRSHRTSRLTFDVMTKDAAYHLGKINKTIHQFVPLMGSEKPQFSDLHFFGAGFYASEIDVKVKVLVLGTLFLLSFEFINYSGD